jgi:thiol-disulfide isomerase/thioredoxin
MRFPSAALVFALLPAAAWADRTQVYSLQGVDCASCAEAAKRELKKIPGVKKVEFDKQTVEMTVRMADGVADEAVLAAIARAEEGLSAVVGAGQGRYLAFPDYPAGSDVQLLTSDGSAVGPLERLAVAGKHTVFDVFAEWCGPCREVDEKLRDVVAARRDVAVRRLNVVDFDTPLARELGSRFDTLPYVVVFTPRGKRIDIAGRELEALDEALARP